MFWENSFIRTRPFKWVYILTDAIEIVFIGSGADINNIIKYLSLDNNKLSYIIYWE